MLALAEAQKKGLGARLLPSGAATSAKHRQALLRGDGGFGGA